MELSINIINELNLGKYNNYVNHKKETIREFRNYLIDSFSKKEFNHIFSIMLSIEENEIIDNPEYISELCILYNLSMLYKHANKHLKFKLVRIILYCINKSNGSDMFSYVNRIFNCISKNSDLLNQVMEILFNFDRLKEVLFYQYVNENFKTITNASQLLNEVDFWNENSPKVVSDNYYADSALNRTEKIIKTSNYENPAIKRLINNFNSIFLSDEYKNRLMKLYKSSEDALLKTIDLETITAQELKEIAESIRYTDGFKVKILKYSNYALNALTAQKLEKIFNEFYMLEKSEVFYIKKILKRLLQNNINQENYTLIIFAHTNSDEFCIYEKLIEYIGDFDKTTLYDFIKWSLSSGVFRNKRTMKIDSSYIDALKDYIINNDKEVLKNKDALKEYFTHSEAKKLIEDVKYKLAGPVKRALFFRAG